MKSIKYLEVLKRAFLLTWENKFLWVFGFFIFLGTIGSNSDIFFRSTEDGSGDSQMLVDFAQNNPNVFIGISFLFLIFCIAVFLLRVVATVAVIKSANNMSLYSQLSFSKIFNESKKYLWRLLFLGILIGAGIFVIAILLIVPIGYLFTVKAEIFGIMMSVLAFAIFFPLVILAIYLNKYAYLFLILGDFNIKESLELAHVAFSKNLKESLIMGLISLVLNMILALVIIVVAIITLAIFGILGFLANIIFVKAGMVIVAIVGGIFGITILIGLLSWYMSFMQTAWLFFFQEISFERDKEKKAIEKTSVTEVEISSPEVI